MWVLSVELLLKAFPQVLHLWGFSSVWIILWRQSVDACMSFPNEEQNNLFFIFKLIKWDFTAPA